ncbi:MAG: DUF4139 domain-containing protein [Lentisphaerae bacterium]|nr:DUF4139 domain-containing protein [Lentisphaerota bacterium]
MNMRFVSSLALGLAMCIPALAKVDLVTLPTRDGVQLTIYNSADLTLVRETRALTLKKGLNRLQFSWANTLIDPTSLELRVLQQAEKILVRDLSYPPRVQNIGVWAIESEISGKAPVEITYLTSGLSWRAFYHGVLSRDESVMRLEGYVQVSNSSGEDYENAQTRVIVGQVHMIDEIAELARREYPYGSPATARGLRSRREEREKTVLYGAKSDLKEELAFAEGGQKKEIVKEGLSEYFLYTIEGTETIPTGWSKRLPSFDQDGVGVVNLYKHDEKRYGPQTMRFLSFKNDKEHKLGQTPIPGGLLRVYRNADSERRLSYEGQSEFKYIPVNEDVELNLGPAPNVLVEPKVMDFRSENYQTDNNGNIVGWDEVREVRIEVKNTRDIPVKVEIRRGFEARKWEIAPAGDCGDFEKVDKSTVKFTLKLDARSSKVFTYTLTSHFGTRAEY